MPLYSKRPYSQFALNKMSMTARKFAKTSGSAAVRRQRTVRPRKAIRNSRLNRALSLHSYSRYQETPDDFSLTGLELDGAATFSLSKISAPTDFSNLYDRYRITAVQIMVTLINNPNAVVPPITLPVTTQNVTNWYPKFWYCRDYDDDNTITLSNMRERSGVKCVVLRPNKVYKFTSRPAVSIQTYRTSTTTGYAPKWRQWIDMAQQNVPHYGFKWVLDTQGLDPADTQPFKLRIEYKYFFTCKDVL